MEIYIGETLASIDSLSYISIVISHRPSSSSTVRLRSLCHVLGVSRSGFYAWTARLMRHEGFVACTERQFRWTTTVRAELPAAPNHLAQNFQAIAPNQRWVSDITSIRTSQGWLHLAIVLDLYSRRIVGRPYRARAHTNQRFRFAASDGAARTDPRADRPDSCICGVRVRGEGSLNSLPAIWWHPSHYLLCQRIAVVRLQAVRYIIETLQRGSRCDSLVIFQ